MVCKKYPNTQGYRINVGTFSSNYQRKYFKYSLDLSNERKYTLELILLLHFYIIDIRNQIAMTKLFIYPYDILCWINNLNFLPSKLYHTHIQIIDVKWERYRNEDHEWMYCNIKCNNKMLLNLLKSCKWVYTTIKINRIVIVGTRFRPSSKYVYSLKCNKRDDEYLLYIYSDVSCL